MKIMDSEDIFHIHCKKNSHVWRISHIESL